MLEIKTTDTEWREIPDKPIERKTMKIKPTEKCRTINNVAVVKDKSYEVDENTARNLIKKGFATPADDEAKAVDLEDPSRLSEEQAESQAEQIHEQRQADKEKTEAAAKTKKKR